MELSVPLESVCRLIVRARELEAQVPMNDMDEDEDPTDSDDPVEVLEDEANEAVEEEVRALLEDLADDEIAEESGSAHACTPVTYAQLVCRLLIEKYHQTRPA